LPFITVLGADYLTDMQSVRDFARESRREILLRALEVIAEAAGGLDIVTVAAETIEISHNYAALEEHFGERLYVHRKGAIHLPGGSRGLLPGSMGTGS
jgi:tRNA-splicing ligase RtcB